jgi:hypothetical protein
LSGLPDILGIQKKKCFNFPTKKGGVNKVYSIEVYVTLMTTSRLRIDHIRTAQFYFTTVEKKIVEHCRGIFISILPSHMGYLPQ